MAHAHCTAVGGWWRTSLRFLRVCFSIKPRFVLDADACVLWPFLLCFQPQQAELLGREDQHRLHRNRKLVLMVDLDQTLIHTTEQHCQQMSNRVSVAAAPSGPEPVPRPPSPCCARPGPGRASYLAGPRVWNWEGPGASRGVHSEAGAVGGREG